MKKFISWRRVSTKKQGQSGLGLEAQKSIIEYFVNYEEGELIADYCEVYTGTELNGCVELKKAMAHAKRENATLIIAKSDRLRNTMEALQIYEEMHENIYFCDLPHTDKFTLTLFFSLAEREALLTSVRTKKALEAKKARGEKTGGSCRKCNIEPILNKARKVSAKNRRDIARNNPHNKAFKEFMELWQQIHGKVDDNTDFISLSHELNERNKKTSSGLSFDPKRARAMFTSLQKIYNNI